VPFEIELLEAAGATPGHFGKRILRVDTAVVALLGMLMRPRLGPGI
jgi:16S rRNA U1498 N3-methylase RsmE